MKLNGAGAEIWTRAKGSTGLYATKLHHPGHVLCWFVLTPTTSGDSAFPYERRFCLVPTHFRFLMNIKLSFWQTYSNPTSMILLISSWFCKTLTVKPSPEASKIIFWMLMYISVFLFQPQIDFLLVGYALRIDYNSLHQEIEKDPFNNLKTAV